MKINDFNYYGFDHNIISKKLKGKLTYIGTFDLLNEYKPCAVYHSAKPNKNKGHKEYVLLNVMYNGVYVRGMSKTEIKKFAIRDAILCASCDEVVFSCMRHHEAQCACKNVTVDGGSDYLKYRVPLFNAVIGRVNLLTNTFKPNKKSV